MRLYKVKRLDKIKQLTLVLSVLLFNLGQVLELDSLPLEDGSLHVLDHFLLLLPKLFVSELHPMDFLLHGDNFSLTNGWIKGVLHFFLKLNLSFPEQDLSLGFNNVGEDVSFLLLEV